MTALSKNKSLDYYFFVHKGNGTFLTVEILNVDLRRPKNATPQMLIHMTNLQFNFFTRA